GGGGVGGGGGGGSLGFGPGKRLGASAGRAGGSPRARAIFADGPAASPPTRLWITSGTRGRKQSLRRITPRRRKGTLQFGVSYAANSGKHFSSCPRSTVSWLRWHSSKKNRTAKLLKPPASPRRS